MFTVPVIVENLPCQAKRLNSQYLRNAPQTSLSCFETLDQLCASQKSIAPLECLSCLPLIHVRQKQEETIPRPWGKASILSTQVKLEAVSLYWWWSLCGFEYCVEQPSHRVSSAFVDRQNCNAPTQCLPVALCQLIQLQRLAPDKTPSANAPFRIICASSHIDMKTEHEVAMDRQ